MPAAFRNIAKLREVLDTAKALGAIRDQHTKNLSGLGRLEGGTTGQANAFGRQTINHACQVVETLTTSGPYGAVLVQIMRSGFDESQAFIPLPYPLLGTHRVVVPPDQRYPNIGDSILATEVGVLPGSNTANLVLAGSPKQSGGLIPGYIVGPATLATNTLAVNSLTSVDTQTVYDFYVVRSYPSGIQGSPERTSWQNGLNMGSAVSTLLGVVQLQIAPGYLIPSSTAAMVTQVNTSFFMQVPVWLP